MQPIIYLGPLEISTYAVMLSLGACLGFWLTYREAERKGLDTVEVLELTAIAFAAGLVGARGLAWLASPQSDAQRGERRPLSRIQSPLSEADSNRFECAAILPLADPKLNAR